MPAVFFSGCDPSDDLAKIVAELLDHGELFALDDGVLLVPSSDPDDRARARHRARQRRYRTRKRDGQASQTGRSARDAGDAPESENSNAFSGVIQSLPTPEGGREGVTEPRNGDAGDASPRDAGDVSPRDARVTRDARPWDLPPLTDEQRDVGREQSRQLAERLRNRGNE